MIILLIIILVLFFVAWHVIDAHLGAKIIDEMVKDCEREAAELEARKAQQAADDEQSRAARAAVRRTSAEALYSLYLATSENEPEETP